MEWISGKDRLPEPREKVKLKRQLGSNDIYAWESTGWIFESGKFSVKHVPEIRSYEESNPTHWQPLPPNPLK